MTPNSYMDVPFPYLNKDKSNFHTSLSGRRDGRDFSTSNSALVSILGREKYMQASRMTAHARTVPPSERCFFVLLLLVVVTRDMAIFLF